MAKWPAFVTKDLDLSSDEGNDAMLRRWEAYDREMKVLIQAGGVHQDEDGWWVDDATGELIGPDPEIERPRTEEELSAFKPFEVVHPELAEQIRRSRGRPPIASPKKQVTLRIDAEVLERLRRTGPGWQSRVNDALKKVVGL